MKKTYIKPSMEVIKINTTGILAASAETITTYSDEVNTSDANVQLGRDGNTPSNPNLWEQGW